MRCSIKNTDLPDVPDLKRDYKKRPKPVSGYGKYIKVLESPYKPSPTYEIQRPPKKEPKPKPVEPPKERKRPEPRVWTAERVDALIEAINSGKTTRQAAEVLGMPYGRVSSEVYKLRQEGRLEPDHSKKTWSNKDVETMMNMRANGISYDKIGMKLNRSGNAVRNKYLSIVGGLL